MRWGELTELRPIDIDAFSQVLTVSRVVVELVPKFHPEGGRFLIKNYPKDREHRRLKLNQQIVDALIAHIKQNKIGLRDRCSRSACSTTPVLRPTRHRRISISG